MLGFGRGMTLGVVPLLLAAHGRGPSPRALGRSRPRTTRLSDNPSGNLLHVRGLVDDHAGLPSRQPRELELWTLRPSAGLQAGRRALLVRARQPDNRVPVEGRVAPKFCGAMTVCEVSSTERPYSGGATTDPEFYARASKETEPPQALCKPLLLREGRQGSPSFSVSQFSPSATGPLFCGVGPPRECVGISYCDRDSPVRTLRHRSGRSPETDNRACEGQAWQ